MELKRWDLPDLLDTDAAGRDAVRVVGDYAPPDRDSSGFDGVAPGAQIISLKVVRGGKCDASNLGFQRSNFSDPTQVAMIRDSRM